MARQSRQASADDPLSRLEKAFERSQRRSGRRENKRTREEFERSVIDLIDRSKLSLDLKLYSADGHAKAKRLGTKTKVRISCVSSPLTVEGSGPSDRNDLQGIAVGEYKITAPPLGVSLKAWSDDRFRELSYAIQQNLQPDILCFGELVYPPPLYAPDIGCSLPNGSGLLSRKSQFDGEILKILKQYESDAFVFGGSFHCLHTQYGVGVIFPYGRHSGPIKGKMHSEWWSHARRGHPTSDPQVDAVFEVDIPIVHKKRHPARSIGEVTRVPSQPDLAIFEREKGTIAILICSDIIDLNQFIALARANLNATGRAQVDYVLVPSFNTSRIIGELCRELSLWSAAIVVNVNANHTEANFPNTSLYLCGKEVEELRALSIITAHDVAPIDLPSGAKSTLNSFELDLRRSDRLRKSMLNSEAMKRYRIGGIKNPAPIT